MSPIQTNTQQGDILINSGEDLTGKEGHLVVHADEGTKLEVLLPTDEADVCLYQVEEGAAQDSDSTIHPLIDGEMRRMIAKGTGSAGDTVVLADPATAADKGKVEKTPADADTYYSPGHVEEDFVDGQHVKVRVNKQTIVVS